MTLEEILGLIVGLVIGTSLFLYLHTDLLDNYPVNSTKWKLFHGTLFIILIIARLFIKILGCLLLGSLMLSAKEKYWDKK